MPSLEIRTVLMLDDGANGDHDGVDLDEGAPDERGRSPREEAEREWEREG